MHKVIPFLDQATLNDPLSKPVTIFTGLSTRRALKAGWLKMLEIFASSLEVREVLNSYLTGFKTILL